MRWPCLMLLALALAASHQVHVFGRTDPGDKAALLALKAGVTKVCSITCGLVPSGAVAGSHHTDVLPPSPAAHWDGMKPSALRSVSPLAGQGT